MRLVSLAVLPGPHDDLDASDHHPYLLTRSTLPSLNVHPQMARIGPHQAISFSVNKHRRTRGSPLPRIRRRRSQHLLDGVTTDGELKPDSRDRVLAELRGHFRPEFLNRVDDIVLFTPLTLPQIEHIVELQLTDLRNRLSERQIHLDITPEARRLIAEHGFDPVYGARPLRRYIAHEVETKIGRALLRGEIEPGGTISVTVDGDELAVTYAEPAVAP